MRLVILLPGLTVLLAGLEVALIGQLICWIRIYVYSRSQAHIMADRQLAN